MVYFPSKWHGIAQSVSSGPSAAVSVAPSEQVFRVAGEYIVDVLFFLL